MKMKYELIKLGKSHKYYGTGVNYQIKALKSFNDVKKGDLGGYVNNKDNLSQKDDCWIYDNAKAYGNTKIYDNAKLYGNSRMYDNSSILDNACMYDNACMSGNSSMYGFYIISGNSNLNDKYQYQCK